MISQLPFAVDAARRIVRTDEPTPGCVRFSVATLVNDHAQYEAMCASLRAGGFDGADCEYLHIDNTSEPQVCAFRGLDAMLSASSGEHVILCHQDVRLLSDSRAALETRLAELEALDGDWAVAGNAGGVAPGTLALRISDPHGRDQHRGLLPARVSSLDENFLVVKRSARIGFSRDLSGFHLYGADLCLNADMAGYHAYVIDFHLAHLSGGTKSPSFHEAERHFRAKWCRALRPRWVQTTCTLVRLSGDALGLALGRLAERPVASLSRRLARAREGRSFDRRVKAE